MISMKNLILTGICIAFNFCDEQIF